MSTSTDIKEVVKEKYGQAALRVQSGKTSCCGGGSALGASCDPITTKLYSAEEGANVPEEALLASLGCGHPTALAKLNPGETVLDLGSGGGIDVLLSARRVGPTGKAYGLDMTDEMLALARENQKKAGVENVEFLRGEIESIPLPDNSVDVIISNCVINLSADKDKVFREAFRVLKPGGRLAVRAAAPRDRKVRLEGGRNVHDAARAAGAKRYIVQSTGFFYGPGAGLAVETDLLAVDASPGVAGSVRTYLQVEERVLGTRDMEGVALRYGFFYGPGRSTIPTTEASRSRWDSKSTL